MTIQASETEVAAVAAPARSSDHASYVDWAAIIAGAVLASAIWFVLFTFGSGIGLSIASPLDADNPSPVVYVIATSLWFIWITISSFMAGGYLAGRLRRRLFEGTPHEADVRDGSHGLLVWALGTLISVLIVAVGASGALRTGVEAASNLGAGAAHGVAEAAGDEGSDLGYMLDSLLRPAAPDAAATDGTTATLPVPSASQSREQIDNILREASTAEDGLSEADRSYAARLIAGRTGLTEAEAAERIDATVAELRAAEDDARAAAETARKLGILATFLTTVTLIVAALGAWWAAGLGGRHRDEGTEFLTLVRWR